MSNQNSRQVEERVVSMQFDNAQFERNTKQTLSTLDKLKQKLQFKGATESLRDFSRESNKFDLKGVTTAVDACGQKLSAWSVAGITAIANLTNSAVNAGKNITKALTIEPVFTGFQEYETKIGAIQTIMSNTRSKGTTMEQVVDVLDELNTYADKTIYNFAEMTRNIGTFTAAGIDLEDAASSIQGIANLAAASGSNSQQASTAMYQLSQALAAGSLKLQDWNSVVNAGMGGQLFQDALKQTARESGVAVDEIIEQAGSFRESLSRGWITADILNTTLRKFTRGGAKEYSDQMMAAGEYTQEMADALAEDAASMEDAATKVKTFTQLWDTLKETAQSGWGKTWELIIGNFEQAQTLFTALNDRISPVIDRISDARNTVIEGAMGSPSKWDEMIERMNKAGITTEQFEESVRLSAARRNMDLDELIGQYGSLQAAFENGPLNSHIAVESMKRISSEMMRFKEANGTAADRLEYFQNKVNEVWRGDWGNGIDRLNSMTEADVDYAAVQELVNKTMDGSTLKLEDMTDAQLKAFGLTKDEMEEIKSLRSELGYANDEMSDFRKMILTIDQESGRELMFQSIVNSMDAIASVVKPIASAFRETFSPVQSEDIYGFLQTLQKFTKSLILTDEKAEKLKRTFKGVFAVLDSVKFIISTGLRLALRVIGALLGNINIDFLDLTATIGDQLVVLSKWIKEHDVVTKVMEKIGPILNEAGKAVSTWIDKLKETDNIPKYIADGIAKGLGFVLQTIGTMFKSVFELVGINVDELLEKVNFDTVTDAFQSLFTILKDSIFNGLLGGDVFTNIKNLVIGITESIANGVENGASIITDGLKNVFNIVSKWIQEHIDPGAVVAGVFIGSMMHTLNTLAELAEKFSGPAEALQGMFESIGGAFNTLNGVFKSWKFNSTARGVLMLAISIGVLAASIYLVSKIPAEDLTRSVQAIAAMSAIVLVMTYLVSKCNDLQTEGNVLNFGVLAGLVLGLIGMALSIKMLSSLDPQRMNQGLIGLIACLTSMVAVLLVCALVLRKTDQYGLMMLADAMRALGTAMLLMSVAVKIAGSMHAGEMKRGLAFVVATGLIIAALILCSRKINELGAYGLGGMLVGLGVSMILLVSVVKKAASISNAELKQALKVMGGIALIMAGLILISKIGGRFGAGVSLLGMSASVLILALTIKMIGNISMEEVDYATLIITSIGALFVKFLTTSLFAGKNAAKAGVMLLAASGAMAVMVGLIWLIGRMDMGNVTNGLFAVGMLTQFMKQLIKATKGAESITSTVIAMAICIATLSAAVYALSFIPIEKLAPAVGALSIIVTVMSSFIKAASTIKGESFKSLIVVFSGMIILFGMISLIMLILSTPFFDLSKTLKTAESIGIVMGALAAVMYSVGKFAQNLAGLGPADIIKIGAMLVVLSGVMFVIGGILKKIGGMNINIGWDALLQVSAVLVLLTGVTVALAKFAGDAKMENMNAAVVSLAALSVVMAIIGLVLWVISTKFQSNADWSSVGQIAAILIVLTAVTIALNKFANNIDPKQMGIAIVSILALSAVILVIGVVLAAIDKSGVAAADWTVLAQIGSILAALIVAEVLISKFGATEDWKGMGVAIVAMALMVGVVFLISKVLEAAGPISAGMGTALTISTILIALAVAVDILAAMAPVAAVAWEGIGILELAMAGLVAIIKLLIDWVGPDLPVFGLQLGAFGMAIKPFIESISGITDKAVEGATALAEIFTALVGVAIIDKIVQLFGGDGWTDTISTKLNAFGEAVVAFSNTIGDGIDVDAVNAAANVGQMMAALNSEMPREIPWLEKIIGKKDMGAFGKMLSNFAIGLSTFNMTLSTMKDFDVNKTQNFVDAVMPLINMAKEVPNTGGLLGDFLGNNDIDEWGSKLTPFARYMLGFNRALAHADWDKSVYENFANCITPIIKLSQDIPNAGGKLAELIGDNTVDDFGKRLPAFGEGIASFYNWIQNKNWDKTLFESVQACVGVLIDISDDLDNTGGLIQFFVGQENLGAFGTKIASFGEGLASFDKSLEGTSSFSSGIALRMTKDIKSLASTMPTKKETKTITDSIEYMTNQNLSLRLSQLGGVLTSFANSTSTLNNTTIDSASSSLTLLVSALSNASALNFKNLDQFGSSLKLLGADTVTGFTEAFSTGYSDVSDSINEFLTQVENMFEIRKYRWIFIGRHGVEAIGEGIDARKDEAVDKMVAVVTEMVSTADTYNMLFDRVGEHFVSGLINGINNMKERASQVAGELGEITVQALANALEVHSPSKLTTRIGEFTGMGFVNGLQEYLSISQSTAEELGDGTTKTMTDILAEALALFDDSELHPTITPVLDLSMIQDGFGSIDSLLNGRIVNVGAVGSATGVGATNDDVIRAINDLSASLGNISGDTYNINGITYDDGSAVSSAVKELLNAAKIARRV